MLDHDGAGDPHKYTTWCMCMCSFNTAPDMCKATFLPTHPITAHSSEEASLTVLADAVDGDKRKIFCAHIFPADYFR